MSGSLISENQTKPKVLVTHPKIHKEALDILSDKCELIILENFPPIKSELYTKCKGVDAIFWRGRYYPVDKEFLDATGPQLKCISTMSAGFDFIDVDELKKRNISLGFTSGIQNKAVAELAIGLMIAAARRFHQGRKAIETSSWDQQSLKWMLGKEIRGAKVGFFGFGNIAQAIADRLVGFKVGGFLYHSRNRTEKAEKYRAEYVTFEKLLKESEFLFIACPLTEATREKFNEAAFDQMNSNAVLINISRGGIIEQKALYEALKSDKIFAAALDVMTPEPLPPNDPLMSLPNCVIIPHLGASTNRTRTDMAIVTAHNILQALDGKPMLSPAF